MQYVKLKTILSIKKKLMYKAELKIYPRGDYKTPLVILQLPEEKSIRKLEKFRQELELLNCSYSYLLNFNELNKDNDE